MNASLLIVEDEPDLASLIADYARAAGYTPTIIGDGKLALESLRQSLPDLIVLDIMLPNLDGINLCREVRRFSQVPIIMVTARVEEIDRLLGLDIGADDYLCKPFSPRELMARIKTILRRCPSMTKQADASHVQCEAAYVPTVSVRIDGASHRVYLNEVSIELTRSEYLILVCFVGHRGQVFSRAQLLDIASQDSLDVTDRAVDSHIKNLRKKLSLAFPDKNPIYSIYGLGYRFDGF